MYTEIKTQFEQNQNREYAAKEAKYMRDKFTFYGIPAPKVRSICKDFLKAEKSKKVVDWDFLDKCFANEHREFQYVAVFYLKTMEKFLVFDDIAKIKTYIQTKSWWDTIDGICGIVGNIGLVDERVDKLMLEWSRDEDFWVRRIAIIHQLNRKMHTNTELLETIICNNFGSSEFFINKAIGWSLREYSKHNPMWVRNFIEKYGDKMAKLSIREASKYI